MFSFKAKYSLENEVVRISHLEEQHFEPLLEVANDQDIWKYFIEKGYGRKPFEEYLAKALKKRELEEEYPMVIYDQRAKRYAGMTRLYALDEVLGNVKLGHTWIGKQFQGTGLNKNCKYLLFEFIFDQLKFQRIGFGASEENIRSIQAMKSVGCQQEGVLRSFMPSVKGNHRVDIVLMSILYEDWNLEIRQKLKNKITTH